MKSQEAKWCGSRRRVSG